MNKKNEAEWASVPVAVLCEGLPELHRQIEYPASNHKDASATSAGGATRRARSRGRSVIGGVLALQGSPFFDVWACAGIDETLSALYEKMVVGDS